ncbi:trmO [Symbiodinium sp. CCMP2456]|nr:trmO [Symbiodinium sp. CCMP2456]
MALVAAGPTRALHTVLQARKYGDRSHSLRWKSSLLRQMPWAVVCFSSRSLVRCFTSRRGEVPAPKRASRPPQVHTDAFPTPMEVSMQTLAVVRSPYKERFGCPRQPTVTEGVLGGEAGAGFLELVPSDQNPEEKLRMALRELSGFEFIWVISYLHMNEGWSASVTPPRGPRRKRGLFATRAPHRPNHIGLSACRLLGVDAAKLQVSVHGLDLLDGTPVLDIKPYVPYCDSFAGARAGWLEEIDEANGRDHLAYWPPPPPCRQVLTTAHRRPPPTLL